MDLDNIKVKKEKKQSRFLDSRTWTPEEVIAETTFTNVRNVQQVLKLLDQECTIPFIARYRSDQTGGLEALKLREIQENYETIKTVEKKVETIIKSLSKEKKDSPGIIRDLHNAKTLSEVEMLYAPLKSGSNKSLAERARQLGLEESASLFLNPSNKALPDPESYIKTKIKGLSSKNDILLGWQHILADVIAKDRQVLDFINKQYADSDIHLISHQSDNAKKMDSRAFVEGKTTKNFKYENYFNFSQRVKCVRPHQVMALNRGENSKILTVKVDVPSKLYDIFAHFCKRKWEVSSWSVPRLQLMEAAIKDCYNRLLQPYLKRHTRAELTKMAIKESILVFGQNLKNLLLRPPHRGKVVLGIDPGFKNGCKLALVSKSGDVLDTDIIYLNQQLDSQSLQAKKLQKIMIKHQCDTIALGNGTASRDMEAFLSKLIRNNTFYPLNVKYCTITEDGASIYSVTKEADIEFPNMKPNFRSAVCIARRLQDPLLEFSKVEPKHLGVGMYQHDIPEAQLKKSLDAILVECVSFVGVDVNVCPEFLLKKISGLNASKAQKIVEWRDKNGPFQFREQLLQVKGLGPKSYEQCCGFIKICSQTFKPIIKVEQEEEYQGKRKRKANSTGSNKRQKTSGNKLDATIIHPESYTIAEKFLDYIGFSVEDIGTKELINKVKSFKNHKELSEKFAVLPGTLKLIVDTFKLPLEYDLRSEFDQPLFVQGIKTITDLKVGDTVTGQVSNMTHFGAFVDIGVESQGLIHSSNLGNRTVALGQRVSVKILSIDIVKKRISLKLSQIN